MFGFGKKKETRNSIEVTQSSPEFLRVFGLEASPSVSMEEALGVPAVWAAINFIAGTVAGLPLHVYDKSGGSKKKVKDTAANPVVSVLHDAVNDEMSSFDWRYSVMVSVLTEGRSVTYIERNDRGQPINLFPMPDTSVRRLTNGRKEYYGSNGARQWKYDQADVIDIAFMLRSNLLQHRSPLRQCAVAIGKAANANEYGSKLFKNGGLPAFALEGPFGSQKSAARAADDVAEATKEAARKGGNVLAIPLGHTLKELGSTPEKMQLVATQEFAVQEVARIYSLPPTFLQDLSRATFSNSEQQDLHLVKHTMKRWLEQLEAEMNLKLFGRGSKRIAEFNLDGLLRGDYATRMEGNARAIMTGQLMPDEARAMDNRDPLPNGVGARGYMQGATVPLGENANDDA